MKEKHYFDIFIEVLIIKYGFIVRTVLMNIDLICIQLQLRFFSKIQLVDYHQC